MGGSGETAAKKMGESCDCFVVLSKKRPADPAEVLSEDGGGVSGRCIRSRAPAEGYQTIL